MIASLGGDLYTSPEHAKAAKTTVTEADRLKEACQGFEAIFMHKMMQAMRQATMESGLIKKSNGEKIFTDMLDEQLTDQAAKSSVNGIADMLFESLKRTVLPEEELQNGLMEMRKANRASAAELEMI